MCGKRSAYTKGDLHIWKRDPYMRKEIYEYEKGRVLWQDMCIHEKRPCRCEKTHICGKRSSYMKKGVFS